MVSLILKGMGVLFPFSVLFYTQKGCGFMKNLCFIRILALVLAICLLAGLCACGKKTSNRCLN